jgi:MFS family permease
MVLFVVGFTATSQMAATNTIIQERVPEEMRSRLMAVYATMFMGVMPIGALIAGYVAKHVGAPRTILMFGGVVLAGCLVFLWRVAFRLRDTRGAAVGTGVIEG